MMNRETQADVSGSATSFGKTSKNGQHSLWPTMLRILETGQQLVMDRFELARLETREDIADLSRNLLVAMASIPIVLMGWVALMAGIIIAIEPAIPYSLSLSVLGVIHVVTGGLLAYIFTSKLNEPERKNDQTIDGQKETFTQKTATGDRSSG